MLGLKAKTQLKKNAVNRIRRNLRQLDNSFVTSGVHQEAGSYSQGKSPPEVAEVAFWNEFGTETAPERAFLRTGVDTNRQALEAKRDLLLNMIVEGDTTVLKALDSLGFSLKTSIENRIKTAQSWAQPNAPSTARQKNKPGGSARGAVPLQETLLLLRSITWKSKVVGR